MSKIFERERDYEIDSGKYKQNNLIFIRSERSSKRCISSQSKYVHTCYSANKMFIAAGEKNAIVPMCQPCAEFSSESKVKKSLFGKTQFSPKVANRFKCKWLLRSSIPSALRAPVEIDQEQEQSTSSPQELQNEIDESTVKTNTKRKRRSTSDIVEDIASEFELKINDLESEISNLKKNNDRLLVMLEEAKKNNLSMEDTLLKSVEHLKSREAELNDIRSKLPLNKMLEKVILNRPRLSDAQ